MRSGVKNMKKILSLIVVSICICFVMIFYMEKQEIKDKNLGISTKKNNPINEAKEEINKEENLIEHDENADEQLNGEEEIKEEESLIEYITLAPESVRIPILMYHSISDDDPDNSLLVPIAMFNEQMLWLKENGFTAMSMDEALEAMTTGTVPKKPVVISFDDGYADNYYNAFPILKEHGMKGTFFIITDRTDTDGWYMSSAMLREMNEAGMEIENHTSNHLELNSLSREEQIASIKNGQDTLRQLVGVESEYLCYPVGRYDDITIDVSKELGIKAAVTTQGGISSINDGSYELKRVRISPMSIEGFASIFSEYIY